MKYTADQIHDVFNDVFRQLAGSVRGHSHSNQGWMTLQPILMPNTQYVHHPFVCAEGYVYGQVTKSAAVQSVAVELPRCTIHTEVEDRFYVAGLRTTKKHVCTRHPVIEPDILAAFLVGGPEAVASTHVTEQTFRPSRKRAFNEDVYRTWMGALASFKDVIDLRDNHTTAMRPPNLMSYRIRTGKTAYETRRIKLPKLRSW